MATEGIREKSPLSVKDSFFTLLYELSLSDDVRTLSKRTSDEVTENDYQMKKIRVTPQKYRENYQRIRVVV